MKPLIVHITNDYPDPLLPQKTKAVQNLVEGTPQYRHIVYSLNRANAWSGLSAINFGDDRVAVAYGALPKGIGWGRRLQDVAQWISADLKAKGIKPDLIEAHKFTIEGIIGLTLSQEFSCPLICDLQGYTDINMLRKKPAFHDIYRRIAQHTSAVFSYAPWPLSAFEMEIGLDKTKCHNLPVIPSIDNISAAPIIQAQKLLSVFHLDGWKNKNFEGIVQAAAALKSQGRDVTLDIYGAGSPKTMLTLQAFINRQNAGGFVTLKGPIENGRMPETMQKYIGFVMPSHSESYGLVYAEALFSGVSVLLNTNRGISGYFDLSQIGYGCDPANVDDIARGMIILLDHQKRLKDNIAQMQKRGVFDFMRRHAILKTYTGVIDRVLSERQK